MVNLGFTRKLDGWVPQNLTAKQRDDRIANCVFLLSRYKNYPFLIRMVTEDEKWVMYRNVKHRRTMCCPSDLPASTNAELFIPRHTVAKAYLKSFGAQKLGFWRISSWATQIYYLVGEIDVILPNNSGRPSITFTGPEAYPKSPGAREVLFFVFRDGEPESKIGF
ncbi:hypothetical protein TNCV_2412291 [Trichonephila clavipes]|nr:hypothetical protein TNCV_2412291 [Trichonephila clavipes]